MVNVNPLLFTVLTVSIFHLASSTIAEQRQPYSWYSTITELRDLVKMEKSMITDLANDLAQGSFTIDQLITQTRAMLEVPTSFVDVEKHSSDDYLKIRRSEWFAKQLSHIRQTFAEFNSSGIKGYFNKIKALPTANDLDVVMRVLLDLQKSLSLNTSDLSNGYIMETDTGKMLSARMCFILAKIACQEINHYTTEICRQWTEQASKKLSGQATDYENKQIDQPLIRRLQMAGYSRLCSESINETFIGNWFNPQLKCFLWDNYHHPLLILQPVRAELLSVNPTIVLFYDVISSEDITYVRNVSEEKLAGATTYFEDGTSSKKSFDDYRIAHNNRMDDPEDPVLLKVDRLIEAISRLPVTNYSEYLQVANYGVGGHYKPHWDAYISEYTPADHVMRRATYLYYLTDVQYGGATVFPYLEIAVRPAKGAALYWHNLLWNTDEVDKQTLHAACPVLLGNKWIANKWISDDHGKSICEKHQYHI